MGDFASRERVVSQAGDPPMPTPPVQVLLQTVESSIERLNGTLQQLGERMSPALADGPRSVKAKEELTKGPISPLEECLLRMIGRLYDITEGVEDIHARLRI